MMKKKKKKKMEGGEKKEPRSKGALSQVLPVGRGGPTTEGGQGPHLEDLFGLGIKTHDAVPGNTKQNLNHLVLLGHFFLEIKRESVKGTKEDKKTAQDKP